MFFPQYGQLLSHSAHFDYAKYLEIQKIFPGLVKNKPWNSRDKDMVHLLLHLGIIRPKRNRLAQKIVVISPVVF